MSRFSQGRFLISAAAPGQFPADLGVEVAFAGRSNAGKSSAINAITQRHGLARTSKTPGRTRLLNFFELGPQQRIVDLPGYGYATGPEAERLSWRPLIDALRGRRSLRGLFLIVDARRGLTEGDLTLLQWAQPGLAVHVLLSKADKLNRSESLRVLRETQSRLPAVSVQLFSALQKTGIPEAQRCLEDWLEKKNPDDLCGHRGQTNPVQVS
ncbi:MAG: YihA family ribosome biogenesis GTP-binding protein [Sinobacteraceae bacterium]|nr:YihA family ribosome biogenesis GTP-binding protein [Nevskiaceae bacterium]